MDQVVQKDLVHQWSHQDRESHPGQVLLGAPWGQLDQKGLADRRAQVGLEDLGDLERRHYHLFPNIEINIKCESTLSNLFLQ